MSDDNTRVMTRAEAVEFLASEVMGWKFDTTPKLLPGWVSGGAHKGFGATWHPFTSHSDAHQLVQRVGELGKQHEYSHALFWVIFGDTDMDIDDRPFTEYRVNGQDLYETAQATPRQKTLAVLRVMGIEVEEETE